MKRSFLLLVLSLFNSASGELRRPLVDICRSRTSDDVSFRLCVTKCREMSPTNQNTARSADVNSVEDLFRQFGSDADIETEGGSAYEVPECLFDPEGSGSSPPPGYGDTEEQNGMRSQREVDEKDDKIATFVDLEKSSDFGDLKKRLTSFVRASQQDLPDKPFARHHISAEEGELLIHADNQEHDRFPVSPAPKIAENREGFFLQIAKRGSNIGGQVEAVTKEVGRKENGSTRWNSVENQADEGSELSKRLVGTTDSNSGDLRPFGEEERTEDSFLFEESKRQSLDRIGQSQSDPEDMADSSLMSAGEFSREEKRPSFVRVGKSFHEEKRPSFVRVGKSFHEEKRPSFVRVGKSLHEEKRPSFVRVGKSLHGEKRPSFVRVGKSLHGEKRPSFVRVGKSLHEEKRPSFVRVGKSFLEEKRPSFVRVGKSLIDEKRPSFVRVGKSFTEEKRPSFVRVGKSFQEEKRPSFVRVGKSELRGIGDEDNTGLMSSVVGIERNCDKNRVKRQSFVRIGKSRFQSTQPQSSSLPSHSNNMRDSFELAIRQQTQQQQP